MILGGDFNIPRYQQEKNNDRFDTRWPFLFNVVIDSLDLRELTLSGRQYTWANNRSIPTVEKLDRVLVTTDWEFKYPLASVRALERIEALSDHAPLLTDFGQPAPSNSRHQFKFELGWLTREGFHELVKKCGNANLVVTHQFNDGTIASVRCANSFVVETNTPQGFIRRRSCDSLP